MKIANSPIYRYKSISSTMDLARELAHSNPPHGSTVVTESQSKGRGNYGRAWHCDPGKGLLMAILMNTKFLDKEKDTCFSRYSLSTALAVSHALQESSWSDLSLHIKWPNDVMSNNRKIAGILLESFSSWLLVGIGVNICSQKNPDHKMGLPPIAATSVEAETGKAIDADVLLHKVRMQIDLTYQDQLWYKKVTETLWGMQETGTIYVNDRTYQSGVIEGITQDGALLLRTKDKQVAKVASGTLRLTTPDLT